MSEGDESGGGWLSDAVKSGRDAVREYTEFLGVERERYVCPSCNVACEEAYTHNPATAAFDGGACPCWVCPECGSEYVREVSDENHAMDVYDRE